jgi:hypothetical protein
MALTGYKPEDIKYEPGKVYMGMDYKMHRIGEQIGHLKAFDVANRKWLWDIASPLPLFSGVLATKSGLVFTGDQLGFFFAGRQVGTGAVAVSNRFGIMPRPSPTSWTASSTSRSSRPGWDPASTSRVLGGTLWVFALDGLPRRRGRDLEGGSIPTPAAGSAKQASRSSQGGRASVRSQTLIAAAALGIAAGGLAGRISPESRRTIACGSTSEPVRGDPDVIVQPAAVPQHCYLPSDEAGAAICKPGSRRGLHARGDQRPAAQMPAEEQAERSGDVKIYTPSAGASLVSEAGGELAGLVANRSGAWRASDPGAKAGRR